MSRIVIDGRILGSSTGRYVEFLLQHLQQLDHDNQYFVLLRKSAYKTWQPTAKNFQPVLADYPMYSRSGQFAIARHITTLKPDLVHFTFQFVPIGYHGPYIITIHDLTQLRFKNIGTGSRLLYGVKHRALAQAIRWAAKRAQHILVPTEYVKQDINKTFGIPLSRISVTVEAAEPPKRQLKTPVSSLQNKDFILYVGTAHAHKNLDRLVDAFRLLQTNREGLHLALAGKHDVIYKRFMARTAKKQIPNIHMLGFVSEAELQWLYASALAYVFPSLSEGFGLPPLEAMGHGLPVVASNTTCIPEVCGSAAHYFNPEDPQSIAKAVTEVLTKTELRDRLIHSGYAQLRKFSWERMAKQTLDVYKKFL
jgi:glycosyltransferase involved in cell wall biosynthesis